MPEVMFRWLVLFLVSVVLVSCAEKEPYVIGFIGPTSGRSADLGISGRNGALLAFEEINASGGINGREIQMIIRDDEQSTERGAEIIQEFQQMNVDAVIGPFTSSVTVAVMPLVDEAELTMLAVTATSDYISNKNDFTLRTVSSTADHAARHGAYHYSELGFANAHVIYDMGNAAYTQSWYGDYSRGFASAGGDKPMETTFVTGNDVNFDAIAAKVLSTEPDLIVLCANAVDAAALAKAIRLQNETVQIATSEWAGTERLISLGGRYVEGIIVPQYLDRQDARPAYAAFRDAYRTRFSNQEPGFSGKIAYNGAKVLSRALGEQKGGEPLRDTIVRLGTFEGVQGDIVINEFGDSKSETYISRIQNGEFISQAELK
jgi:branched-chain amino acid transport system substrate-binding protein